MLILAISEWLAGAGAFLAGMGGLITGIVALRRAKAEAAAGERENCDERLLAMVERHQLWADEELGRIRGSEAE